MIRYLFAISLILSATSCKKFVDPGFPENQLSGGAVFSSDATATAALLAAYAQLERSQFLGTTVSYTGLLSDELLVKSAFAQYQDLANNNLVAANSFTNNLWQSLYQLIYFCNSIIEGASNSELMSLAVKLQIEGEARFLRAYAYFYLLNMFGDIPLVSTTDYIRNSRVSRSSIDSVYSFVEQDLVKALEMVSIEYRSPKNAITLERTRANSLAVASLYSKVALYRKEWQKAIRYSSLVIDSSNRYTLLATLNDVFLKNSSEQIWQIQPVLPGMNTYVGNLMVLTASPNLYYLSPLVIKDFTSGDKRRGAWIGLYRSVSDSFYFSNKYKIKSGSSVISEYTSILRLAEIYLIRAEAKANQGDLAGAASDLNRIRVRSGLPAIGVVDKSSILDSVYFERRRELFTENANRWFDLKRLGKADSVLSNLKGPNWQSTDVLFPIPAPEIAKNNLLTQNPGY